MKHLSFPFLFSLFLFACTSKVMPELQWKGLSNQAITGLKLEPKRLMGQDSESLAGQAESGLALRIIERKGGAKSFGEFFGRIEFLLNSIYQDHQAPYPGQITQVLSCPKDLRPRPLPEKEDPEAKRKGFLLMANDREVFGACEAGKVHFHAAYILIACKKEDIAYEIKMFLRPGEKSMEELARIYESFSCS